MAKRAREGQGTYGLETGRLLKISNFIGQLLLVISKVIGIGVIDYLRIIDYFEVIDYFLSFLL